jgi:Fic family protein
MNEEIEKRVIDEVEIALSSIGKLKILRLLMKNPDHAFTRYEIGKKTPINPRDIKNNIQTLLEIEWLKELNYGHLQKYSINIDHNIVQHLSIFFRDISYI